MRWKIIIFAVIFVIIMFAGMAPAQHLEYVDSQYWTFVTDVEVRDNYAYYCYKAGLMIYDVSDPENPEFISKLYIAGNLSNICLAGDYIVTFGENAKLRLIDITDPHNPRIVGETPNNYSLYDIMPQGDTLYAAADILGYMAFDISNPAEPRIICSFVTGGITKSIVIRDTLMYATGEPYFFQNMFVILSIADIHNPYVIGSLDSPSGECKDLIVDGNFAYLANGSSGFAVIDISDKSNPKFIIPLIGPTNPRTIEKKDNLMFMNSRDNTLQVFDISNPERPQLLHEYESDIAFHDITVRDDILYVAGNKNGFSILDISDVNNITPLSEHFINSSISSAFLVDDYLCVNEYGNRLLIHKLEDPTYPEVISATPTPAAARYHFVDSTTVYVLGNDTLGIIDMSNPFFPSQPIYHNFRGNSPGFFAQRPYLYMPDFYNGIHIYRQRSFSDLEYIKTMDLISTTYNIKIENSIGYISNAPFVSIYDFADPANPVQISYYSPRHFVGYLWVKDGFVYSKGSYFDENFLNIYDCTNPNHPEFVDSLRFPGSITNIEFAGDLAYISDLVGGLHVYDITDMYHPVFLDSYSTFVAAVEFCVVGNYIYLVDDESSLIILRLTQTGLVEETILPDRFALLPNYPNPFNASTTISYAIPEPSRVTLDIYDILGRKVQTLYNGFQPAGEHSLVWNAEELSSGVYFYRISAGDFAMQEKMVLLK